MNPRRAVSAILASVLLLASATLLDAQKRKKEKEDPNTRALEGYVLTEGDAPVQGAVVQLKDLKTLAVRSFFTQKGGDYHFSGLSKDTDYEIKATYKDQESDTKRLTIFDTRKTATINLRLEAAKK